MRVLDIGGPPGIERRRTYVDGDACISTYECGVVSRAMTIIGSAMYSTHAVLSTDNRRGIHLDTLEIS